jgi:hypothetical protein
MPDPLAGRLGALGVGLAAGLVAALACLAVWAWRRRRHPEVPAPIAGLALTGAAVVALAVGDGGVTARLAAGRLAGTVVAAAAAGVLLASFDRRRWSDGLALPLLAVSAAGIWATVPDVEAAVVVMGVCLPFAGLGWPLLRSGPPSLGLAGALATAGLMAWTVVTGGAGRPGSIAGGFACLGMLVAEPLSRLLDRRPRPADRPGGLAAQAVPLLAAHLVLVAVAARVVGRPASLRAAVPLALLELAAGVAVAGYLRRRTATTSPSRRST